MSSHSSDSLPAEIVLMDRYLTAMPEVGSIRETAFSHNINWLDVREQQLYQNYHRIALNNLLEDGLIKEEDAGKDGILYSLTREGRERKREGYRNWYKEGRQTKAFDKKTHFAEGRKKIHDDKVKVFLLGLMILTAMGGLLGKCFSDASRRTYEARDQAVMDSGRNQQQGRVKPETTSLSQKKHHPKTSVPASLPASNPSSTATQTERQEAASPPLPTPKVISPLQIANADNIEFKLLTAEGSSRGQTIKMTLVLTTSAANWKIQSHIRSIFDNDGNEYELKAFTIGASTFLHDINMTTGVPIKCTYTFGGILPNVRQIKLFKFGYYIPAGREMAVEFRDIPIEWK